RRGRARRRLARPLPRAQRRGDLEHRTLASRAARDARGRRRGHDLPRRRAHRRDADRLHRLLALRGRPARLPDDAGARADADLGAHADAPPAGAAADLRGAGARARRARRHRAPHRRRPGRPRARYRRPRHRAAREPPHAPARRSRAQPLRGDAREAALGRALMEALRTRGLGIVDQVELEFGAGLNALTGETGAGKSIVLGALALLAGARAEAGAVREGADEAVVEAVFLTEQLPEL